MKILIATISIYLIVCVVSSTSSYARGGYYQFYPGYDTLRRSDDKRANLNQINHVTQFKPNQVITDQQRIKMEANLYDLYADAMRQLREVEILYQPAHATKPIRVVLPGKDTSDEESYPKDYQTKFPR